MLEKLLLAAAVTFSIHCLLATNSSDISQTNWEVYSVRKTTTEVVNLLVKQPLI
ncbi:MAG: hypothetical protein WBV73_07665 [Phormidium sp.]